MIYLLDVNVLLAWGYPAHVHHKRVSQWLYDMEIGHGKRLSLATCDITELGFVRVASGKAAFAPSVSTAREDLRLLKSSKRIIFLGEALDADCLPAWVTKSDQTTDGYLLKLAATNGARLATLDRRIPGAEFIPDEMGVKPHWVSEPQVNYGDCALSEPRTVREGPRVVFDEVTGYPVVTARPGVPKITSEDVRRMLEDFP